MLNCGSDFEQFQCRCCEEMEEKSLPSFPQNTAIVATKSWIQYYRASSDSVVRRSDSQLGNKRLMALFNPTNKRVGQADGERGGGVREVAVA